MLFLTGGSGFVGSRFIELYAERAQITALERKNAVRYEHVKRVPGDLLDLDSLVRGTKGCRAIVHNGGATPNRAYLEGHYNATLVGTKNMIAAAKANGIRRFIFVSTDCVTQSKGPYALSKLQAEEDVRASGLDWTIFRPKTIVGSGARDLGRMMKFWSRARWIPVIGDGTYRKQPVFVDDLCKAMFLSLDNKASYGQTVTAAGAEGVVFNDFVSRFARALGNRRFRLIHLPLTLVRSVARIAHVLNPKWGLNSERVDIITHSKIVEIERFKKLLGAEPAGFEEMVQKTCKSLHFR
ncbi:MAG: NAD-dependent epimerase/dehydratase family protein [Nitrospiria bacterium]